MKVYYPKDTPLSGDEAILFEELKKWRIGLSKQLNLKAFKVAWDTDLIAIAKIKPSGREKLLSINNFKHDKPYITKYAEVILEIINSKEINLKTNGRQTHTSQNPHAAKQQAAIRNASPKEAINILYHLEYFKKIVEYGFFKEWQTITPDTACNISLPDLRSFLRVKENEDGKELCDDQGNFKRFYHGKILKGKNRNAKYNPDYKEFIGFIKSEHSNMLNDYGYIKQGDSFLKDISKIYSDLKKVGKNEKTINMLEYYLNVKELDLYPLLYKKTEGGKNNYVAPVIIAVDLDYSDYCNNQKVKVKFSGLPTVSPYNLYVNDEIERASNYLMLCEEDKWSNTLNAQIFSNKDAVMEDVTIKSAERWNNLMDFLMDCAKKPFLLKEGITKQNYSFITDKEDQITILRDSYDSFIRHIKAEGGDSRIDYGLLGQYIKKPDGELYVKELKDETNYKKLKESLLNEKELSFTGQIKFNGKPDSMYTLNLEQKIFLHCLKKQEDDIVALNGPPGTGKTTILQSLIATKIVDATLKGIDIPVFFGASFTNQAKNNMIGGFKIEALETGDMTEEIGNIAKRWLPKINDKTIDYGCVTKGNEKSEREGFLDLQDMENVTLHEEWLNEAEKFYMKNFSEINHINFTEELKIFGNFTNFEFNVKQPVKLPNAVKLLKSAVKKIYDSYLLPLEAKKQSVLNLKTIRAKASTINQEIKGIRDSLNLCEGKIRRCGETEKQKDEFTKLWSEYIGKYPVIKRMLPFLQNELELQRMYRDSINNHPDVKEIIKNEPARYKIKSIQKNISKIINDKTVEEAKSGFQAESESLKSKIKQKQSELNYLNERIDGGMRTIERSNGKLDALLNEDISEKELINAYDYLGAIIDNYIKYRLFHLSMRANEGEFILEVRKLLKDDNGYLKKDNKFKKSYDGITKKYKLFSLITPCFVTTMHSIYKTLTYYPGGESNTERPLSGFIDYLLIDEAGQCSPEIGALSFLLAKRAIIVGDTYQIPPVYNVIGHMDYSLYRYTVKSEADITNPDFESLSFNCHENGGSVMKIAQNNSNFWEFPDLERGLYVIEHRRCPKEIIEFSNELMYKGKLKCPDNWGFENMVKDKIFEKQEPWNFINVNGECKLINKSRVNEAEIKAIKEWINNKLESLKPVGKTVAIITPFKAQANAIQDMIRNIIGNSETIIIGTVHALQGAEQKIILFSMTYDKKSAGEPLFIDRNKNIINVAVSRTKQSFYVFGEEELFLKAKEGTATRLLGKYLGIVQ